MAKWPQGGGESVCTTREISSKARPELHATWPCSFWLAGTHRGKACVQTLVRQGIPCPGGHCKAGWHQGTMPLSEIARIKRWDGWPMMTHHFPMSLVGHTWVAWCCMSYSEFGHGSRCQRGRGRERPMTAAYMMHAASGCRSCYAIHSKGETQQSDFPILDKTWRTPTFGQVPRCAWVKMNEVYVCDKISQLSHKVALAQLAKIVFSRASSIRKEWPQLFVNQTRQTRHEAPTGKDWRLPPKLKLVANSVQ